MPPATETWRAARVERGHNLRDVRRVPGLIVVALVVAGAGLVSSAPVAGVPPGVTVFDVPASVRCTGGAKEGTLEVRWGEDGIAGVELAVDQRVQHTADGDHGRATLRVPCDGDVHTIGADFTRTTTTEEPSGPPLFLEERVLTESPGRDPGCPRRVVREQAEFDARQYAPDVTADSVRCSGGLARATIHFPPPQPATAEPLQVYAYAGQHAVHVGGQSLEQQESLTYRTCTLPPRSLRALDLPAQNRRGGVEERNCGLG